MGCGAQSKPAPTGGEAKTQKPIWVTYERKRSLGKGMSCAVYAALNKETKQMVAIKELRKYDSRNGNLDKDQKHMYETEVDILKCIASDENKHCIELIHYQEEAKKYYIVTKLCEGGELFDRVKDMCNFTERAASNLAKQMLEALDYLHKKNIVHRDLKPENFVFESKRVQGSAVNEV
mmetsp:Transcript_6267/g.12504  ORF Transcript_6267/g.12504 Transcript_6267/m.12504 type:complete len:178 (+) Transcript_6267:87-620(+)